MKRIAFALVALSAMIASTGCCCNRRACGPWGCESGEHGGCDSCGGGPVDGGGCSECGMAGGGGGDARYDAYARGRGPGSPHPLTHRQRNAGGQYEFDSGPPTGQVAYPYYTTRGPRDFLAANPRSIGP